MARNGKGQFTKKGGSAAGAPPKAQRVRAKGGSDFVGKTKMSGNDPFSTSWVGGGGQPDFAKTTGRRGAEVQGLSTGPSTTSILNIYVARKRSRMAVLTNPYAKRAIDVLVSNVVGTGHKLFSMAPDKVFSRQVEEAWKEWCPYADTTGQLGFGGLEALALRSAFEGGDSFTRRRVRRPEDNLPVPLQLQVIEAEQVPLHKNEPASTNAAQTIVGGIQFDPVGRPTFYHMYRAHPGDFINFAGTNTGDTVMIPAEDVLHMHEVRRPHDVRGMPTLAQIVIKLSDIDRYLDAELMRKKGAALIGGYVRRPADDGLGNPFAIGDNANEDEEVIVDPLEPGAFPVLPYGYDVSFSEPADVGSNFQVFLKHQLMSVAVATNTLYEQVSGDMSSLNDRTLRAGMLEFKRLARALQENMVIHQFCDPVFDWWFDLAVLSGRIVIPAGMDPVQARRRQWIADPWEHLNPNQELNAEKAEIRMGLKSRDRALLERGEVPEKFDEAVKETKDRQRKLELVFDTDVEAVSDSGTQQVNSPAINEVEPEQPDTPKDNNEQQEDPDEGDAQLRPPGE
jgi:lambda family phage portal protein